MEKEKEKEQQLDEDHLPEELRKEKELLQSPKKLFRTRGKEKRS